MGGRGLADLASQGAHRLDVGGVASLYPCHRLAHPRHVRWGGIEHLHVALQIGLVVVQRDNAEPLLTLRLDEDALIGERRGFGDAGERAYEMRLGCAPDLGAVADENNPEAPLRQADVGQKGFVARLKDLQGEPHLRVKYRAQGEQGNASDIAHLQAIPCSPQEPCAFSPYGIARGCRGDAEVGRNPARVKRVVP